MGETSSERVIRQIRSLQRFVISYAVGSNLSASICKQDISVANPPTFLLLVDKLLGDFAEPSSAHNKGILESCMAEDNQTGLSDGCFVTPTTSGHERESKMEFFRKAHPLLDQWIQWLLVTQRPGAKGWGGGTGKAPPGAFQVRASSYA